MTDPKDVESAAAFATHLAKYAAGYAFVHEYAVRDLIAARDAAVRAAALEECIAVAKQHVASYRANEGYGKVVDEMRAEAIEELIDELAALAKGGGE